MFKATAEYIGFFSYCGWLVYILCLVILYSFQYFFSSQSVHYEGFLKSPKLTVA